MVMDRYGPCSMVNLMADFKKGEKDLSINFKNAFEMT